MIGTICLFAFMLVATVTDVWRQKIYNWTTYTGIVVALLIGAIATGLDRAELGIGIKDSLIGLLSCGLIMLICYVLFQIGGGDVKLLAMAGAFLGPQLGIEMLLWTFVLGGAAAVIILIWKFGFVRLIRRVLQQALMRLSIGNWDPLTEEEKKQMTIPLYLAPSALIAAVVVRFSVVDRLVEAMS